MGLALAGYFSWLKHRPCYSNVVGSNSSQGAHKHA